ncbi:hypothetical protein L1987_14626 [Smallanthus sonchifolius]|uniref:Uncharacterized protein n=1 Tax=Smallanthus sonchifolius TaxID=185202 RepID=A0ACB9J5H5_9ASTR|nr:hypothetical protein L1987_14626 [Smallanthus sonchifolius]
MGDAENTVPPSLKRAAERELSRDNPDLDDEEDVCDQEAGGTFKKDSEEVLANRRIVKVRRNRTSSIPSAPSSNPFASVQLVSPTVSTSTPVTVTDVQESQDNVKKEEACGNQEPESIVDEVEKPEPANAESAKEEAESNEAANDEKKNIEKAATVTSFQQLSSSQNAFTGSSTFSFGPILKGDQPGFPSFSFGTNGNSSLFGPVCDKTEGSKTPSIDKAEVETGEENEKAVFTADSVTSEGKGGLSTFALKFKDAAIVEEFRAVVTRHKGNHTNTDAHVSSLKTPENSPKASDG